MQKDLFKSNIANRFPVLPPIDFLKDGLDEDDAEDEEETDNFSSIISKPTQSTR